MILKEQYNTYRKLTENEYQINKKKYIIRLTIAFLIALGISSRIFYQNSKYILLLQIPLMAILYFIVIYKSYEVIK